MSNLTIGSLPQVYDNASTHMYCVCTYVHTQYVRIHKDIHTVCVYTQCSAYTHTHTHTHTYTYTHIHTHTYTYIHTHTHTHSLTQPAQKPLTLNCFNDFQIMHTHSGKVQNIIFGCHDMLTYINCSARPEMSTVKVRKD